MSTNTGEVGGSRRTTAATDAPPAGDADAIRTDIEQTRADLGDSLQELAHRADIKTRTKEKVAEVKGQAAQVTGRVTHPAQAAAVRAKDTAKQAATKVRQRPARFAGVVAGPAAAVAAVVLVRRRRAAKARTRGWWSR